ncbi:uncharacterized protein LOC136026486 isoform X2 [Artemia franciscana]|uniref:uncharacterized protein LOC136026486 isoform X2 n=1 Tax=Artemia franciscana TaxID=6661 RepID=UPI0032DA0E6C
MNRVSGLTQILTNLNMEESPMITIQCDGGDVEVKKSLLTAVSDVFKAMLEADMLEKRTNVVVANDVHFGTMKTIMDSYKEGTVSGFETRNRDAFVYIVEKYNFLVEAYATPFPQLPSSYGERPNPNNPSEYCSTAYSKLLRQGLPNPRLLWYQLEY